jgi:hypothetical protein
MVRLILFLSSSLFLTTLAPAQVIHLWSGALTAHSIAVHARLALPCDSVRLVLDDQDDWSSPLYSERVATDSSTGLWVSLSSTALDPSTSYAYRIELDGTVDTSLAHTGRFATPSDGPASFSFVTASCNGLSDHPVWQAMGAFDPLFFLCLGDLHYADPTSSDPAEHRNAYEQQVLAHAPAAEFLRNTPLVYIWDDHDYCGNASDSSATGRSAARLAYRECVPHYPLARTGIDEPLDHAFTAGRVRFIVSDLRSTKSDSAMMGAAQELWLRNELIYARDHDLVAAWISSLTWNSIGWPENWGSQPEERRALSDFMREQAIRDLFILSGDAHMLAIDDGTHADHSTGGDSPYRYPILQAAAITRGGSYKGGTFSHGYFPNPDEAHGQFGRVRVEDDGVKVCITLEGWRTDSMSSDVSLVTSYTFCRAPGAPDSIPLYATGANATAFWNANGWIELSMANARGKGWSEVFDAAGNRVMNVKWPGRMGTR